MEHQTKSIRPFIGAKDFELSRSFYRDLGFKETILRKNMSVFQLEELCFYLQDAYVKDWINNTMIFLEIDNVNRFWNELLEIKLTKKYKDVKLVPVKVLLGKRMFYK